MSMKSGKEASDAQLAAELESCRSRIQELERSLAELRENERIGGESEERLRLIAENMMDIIVLVDRNGAYQYVSPSFETVLGYSPALRGRLGFELVHPDDMPAVQNAFMKSILHRSPEKVEYRYRHAKGDYVWLEAVGKPVLNDREELTGAVLCLRDVTERKKAEEALRESEERFRFLAENMADIVWTLDLNLNTTYVSPSIERILGFTPEERKQRPVEEMMTPDSLRRVMEVFLEESRREKKEACDPLRNVIIEVEYYHADGRMLWMENSVKALRDRTGAMIGVYGSSRDITSRRRAEEALRESESKYRELVEFIPVALFEADLNGRVTATNPAIREMFGYDTADLDRGVNGFEVFVSQDQERIRDRFRSVLGGETSGGAEYTGIRKDGSTFPFMTYTSPIMRGGVPVGVRGAAFPNIRRKLVKRCPRGRAGGRHRADGTQTGGGGASGERGTVPASGGPDDRGDFDPFAG